MAYDHLFEGNSIGPEVRPADDSKIGVLICDARSERRAQIQGAISMTNATLYATRVVPERLVDGALGRIFKLALIAVECERRSTDEGEAMIAGVRRLREHAVPVICYGNYAETFPLSRRCQLLLAGAGTLLDSSSATFEGQLDVETRKRVDASAVEVIEAKRIDAAARGLGIIGRSDAMMGALRAVERSARLSDMPVLLVGESGTGKDLLARAVHQLDGRRRGHPFIAVNCAALTKTLAEAELFGHRKGVFSGADRERPGFVRAADGGVLFLDEIGELDLDLQAKLLRVIQDRKVVVVGDACETSVDVRIVAATHRDVRSMVASGRFRLDLFNRLWVYPIEVPPLRQRRADIPALVTFFLSKHERRDHVAPVAGPEFLGALQLAELAGNVRELENIVQRAIAMAEPERALSLEDLPPELWADLARSRPASSPFEGEEKSPAPGQRRDFNLARAAARQERRLLEDALRESAGNQTKAASLLGITARSIYNKLRAHRVDSETRVQQRGP